jgi:hypothetical protein
VSQVAFANLTWSYDHAVDMLDGYVHSAAAPMPG